MSSTDPARAFVSRRRAGTSGGQATIETMLIAALGVTFLAVAFQFYLANRSIARTLQQVHGKMLSGFWEYNNKDTTYDRETVKVIWSTSQGIDAVRVPRVGLLQDDLPEDLHIYSHWVEQHGDPDSDCEPSSPPCKRTKAGGGLDAGSPWELAGQGIEQLASDGYYDWLFFNGANALGDMTQLKETLQDMQGAAQVLNNVGDCIDDPVGCAWDCIWGDCPWDT